MPRSKDTIDHLLDTTFEIQRVLRQEMMKCAGLGRINFQQIFALLIIDDHAGMTMKELAIALHITSPSATTLVDRLVKLQWVARKSDPKNRKLVRLSVTSAGHRVLKQMQNERRTIVGKFFSLLSARECSLLASLHQKLLRRYAETHPSR